MATPYPLPPTNLARKFPVAQKKPSQAEIIQKQFSEQIAEIAGRVEVVEERIEAVRTHLELLDNTVIEKHKATISEINDLKDSMRSMRADLDEIKDFTDRLAKRMDALASKEEVKVLERYVDAWQPLNYITRNELKATVKAILEELGFKPKKK